MVLGGLVPRSDKWQEAQKETNKNLRNSCRKHNILFLETQKAFLVNNQIKPGILGTDGLHLTEKGQDILRTSVLNYIDRSVKDCDHPKINFRGSNHPLSNLFVIEEKIFYKQEYFNSSEQAYQWVKAIKHKKYHLANKIKRTSDTYQQMKLGKTVETSDWWTKAKAYYMREILESKQINSVRYREFLLSSGIKTLIEDTCDPFWGRGADGKGKNTLGTLHSDIRACIR